MTRILSALVLLPIVIGIIWLLPPIATLLLALVVATLAFGEYAQLAERAGARMPVLAAGAATLATCAATGLPGVPVEVVLLTATVGLAALAVGAGRPGPDVLTGVAAALFAPLYIGLTLGALAAVRAQHGAPAVLLLLLTIIVSDTAQYYTGRMWGRNLLAPEISPKKTVEGASGGFVCGIAATAAGGFWWLPGVQLPVLMMLGAVVVVLGIAGDLFESLLKRSAGVKDASGLIPGHGGILDRIDALLFAAPVYYVVLTYG
jgi:phosphatidate cytidylyltransferase